MDDLKNEEKVNKKFSGEKAIRFFAVRLTVCLIFFVFGTFVKIQSPCQFDKLKFWYQENLLVEKYNIQEIKDHTINFAKQIKEFVNNSINEKNN